MKAVTYLYNTDDLVRHIKCLGIAPTDTVMVHTSLKSVGKIDTDGNTTAEVLIDALRRTVPDGLLLIPSHTWATVTEDGQIFDVRESKPCIGAVPSAAVALANADSSHSEVMRSPHPTHSVVAFGRNAAEYVMDDAYAVTPAPWSGAFGKLYESGAKILLIGVGQDRNTYFHAVDEWLDIDNRLSDRELALKVRGYDGSITERPMRKHSTACSRFFINYEPYFEQTGAVSYGRLGDALVRVCDAVMCADAIKHLWECLDGDLCDSEKRLDISKVL